MGVTSPKLSASPDQVRVLSVDDHVLIREGIAALIANQKDMCLVTEAKPPHADDAPERRGDKLQL